MDLWNAIKKEYIAGGTSYRKLAEKYGVSFSTLRKVAAKEQWTELRNKASTKADTKFVEAVSEKNARVNDKYYELVDMLFDKAREVIEKTPVWQVTTLKEMATAMKYLKDCKGVKSDADMREQEARIRNLEKQIERENDALAEIEVVFKAGKDEWNE